MALNIVLHEPEIHSNTGNIGRTCVATGSSLHLIKPLGFTLDDKHLRRAGMDYWKELDLHVYEDYEDFLTRNEGAQLYFATTKAKRCYTDISYPDGAYIMFGKESAGIPEEILIKNRERCVRIPMLAETRSLNLSNSAAIMVYEYLRQRNFEGMNTKGELHRLRWE